MDANLVPDSGMFPVQHIGDHYEFCPPLKIKIGGIEFDVRRVDEDRFTIREDGWNQTLVAEPKSCA